VIAFYALQIVSLATLRVDLTGIAFGLMLLAGVFSHKQLGHWLVPAAIALLQPFVFPHQTPDHHTPAASAWWGMYWTACTLACLWNHRLLVRSFSDGRTE
jgi:hypothetical protein